MEEFQGGEKIQKVNSGSNGHDKSCAYFYGNECDMVV